MSPPARRVAVIGGGLAGVTAVWQIAQLHRAGAPVEAVLYEASERLGGTIETVRKDGFVIECGPDGWVSEKGWARELAVELGLEHELIESNDAERVTYIVESGRLLPMPDGMRMMVPTDLSTLQHSPLFTDAARNAYAQELERAQELRQSSPTEDESVSEFVRRHFGDEVLRKLGAPLLSGVFGGDVARLSVRSVMPTFVELERRYGSLIMGLQAQAAARQEAGQRRAAIFTSLRGGTETLIERMVAAIPEEWIRLSTPVQTIARLGSGWAVTTPAGHQRFEALMLATPAHVARELLRPISAGMAELTTMDATWAMIAAFAFERAKGNFDLPRGFGFLVPAGETSKLLAGTFVDQKFPARVPPGGRLLRAFFGGEEAQRLAALPDAHIAALALAEMETLLGTLPQPSLAVVRRWPRSLPQYGVGHGQRMAELDALVREHGGLWLLGNGYRGVGLPDLIRDARAAVHECVNR